MKAALEGLIKVAGTCADESLVFPAHHPALLPLGAWVMGGVMTVAISQSSTYHAGLRCVLCSQCGHMLMQTKMPSLLNGGICAECESVGNFWGQHDSLKQDSFASRHSTAGQSEW